MAKSPGGRRQKYDEPLSEELRVKFTPGQKRELEERSRGTDVTAYVREIAIGERPGPGYVHPSEVGTDALMLKELTRQPCGSFREALEVSREVALDSYTAEILGARPGDFLCEADGASMEGADILNGDFLLMRPLEGRDPKKSDVTLVMIRRDGGYYEGTVKHYDATTIPPTLKNGHGEEVSLPPGTEDIHPVATAKGLMRRFA